MIVSNTPATDDALVAVKDILQEDLAHHVQASGGDSQTLTVEFLVQTLAASKMLVVDHGDDLLGYLQYQVRPPKIVVNGAAIRATYQGQGLGTRLLARALADAARQGCDTVEISVQPSNVAVWEMVRRQGFQERPGGSD